MRRFTQKMGVAAVAALIAVGCGGKPTPKPVVKKPVAKQVKPKDVGGPTPESKAAFKKGVSALDKGPEGYQDARAAFEEAVKISPKYSVAVLNLAYTYEKLGRYADAAKTLGALIKQGVLDRGVKLAYGRSLLLSGDADLAVTEFESVLRKNPEDLQARNNLAAAYLAKHDEKTALRYVKEVLAVQPKNVPAIINLGLLYQKQKKLPLALLMFKKALGYDKNNARAHNNLGLTFFEMNVVPLAVLEWKQAVMLDPTMDEARLNLASVYIDYLDYASALAQFKKVRERFPNNYRAMVGEANALYGTGDYENAAKLYDASLALKGDNAEVLLRVGKINEEQLGKPKVALPYYEKYVQVTNPPAEHPIRATIKFLQQADQMQETGGGEGGEGAGGEAAEGETTEGAEAPAAEAPEGETKAEGAEAPKADGEAPKAEPKAEGNAPKAEGEAPKADAPKADAPADGAKAADESPKG